MYPAKTQFGELLVGELAYRERRILIIERKRTVFSGSGTLG
jgi:hypothetical protein